MLEGGLPTHLKPRQRCHVDADLGSWLRITCRLPDRDLAWYQGVVFKGMSFGTLGGWLATCCFFLAWPTGEGGGVWSLPWGYWGWVVGWVPGKNRSTVIFRLSWSASAASGSAVRGLSFGLFNMYVDFTILRHTFSRFVSHRCKILCCSISEVKVPSFTNC